MKKLLLSVSMSLLITPFCVQSKVDFGKKLGDVGKKLGLKVPDKVPSEIANLMEAAKKLGLPLSSIQQRVKQYGGLAPVILAKRYGISSEDRAIVVLRAALRRNRVDIKRGLLAFNEKVLGGNWKGIVSDYRTLSDGAFAKKYSREMQQGIRVLLKLYNAAADIYFKQLSSLNYLTTVLTVKKANQIAMMKKLNEAVGIH